MAELLEHQYLTLSLEGERYAIPVSRVREVLESSRITKLPRAAPYLKGIIDLRGRGVPVLDLRLRFGMSEAAERRDQAIIVVEAAEEGESRVAGLLADAVHEVVEIDPSQREPAPAFGGGPSGDFLQGIGKREEGFILLLDLDRILGDEDFEAARAVSGQAEKAASLAGI